jgi:hypothetical protein
MKTPQPIKIFGKQEIDVRKVETTPSYTRPPWLVNENEPIDLIMCAFLKERVGKESRQNFHHLWRTNTKNTIEYTRMDRDGDGKLGFAIVTNNRIIKKRMGPQSSIYSADPQAIITAMENTTQTNKPTITATDSLSTLLAAGPENEEHQEING